jgi:GTP-binding protein
MAQKTRDDVRNLAIIAHVDHGKTTLVDAMLWQSEVLRETDAPDRVRAALDPEREKAIAIMPKIISLGYRGTTVNIMDTPHADLGGEVERTVRIVEGVILLVDSYEGPPAQTRFVLRRALEAGLAPIVVISKIDRPEARPAAVLDEIRGLFADLDATQQQLEFPVLYCNALQGVCRRSLDGADESLVALFEEIVRTVPAPRFDPESPLQFLVTSLDYDDFLGRLAQGRVVNGSVEKDQQVSRCRLDGSVEADRLSGVFGYEGVRRVEIDQARAGDIVSLAGAESIHIGETLSDPEEPRPLPAVKVDEPTLAVVLSANDSPTAGLDGTYTGGRELRERLWQELLTNVAIRVAETDSPDAFRLSGRGELQLAILIEMIRREGFEMLVGKPETLVRNEHDRVEEPMELLVVDCPESLVAVVTEKTVNRKGRMTKMVNHGTGRVRMEFSIPSRGLVGFRTEFLSDTKGTGILHHAFDGWDAWQGEISRRSTGSLVADRPGRATAHAIGHLQHRGTIFVAPDDEVYEGMVVGENSRSNDLEVDVTKEKKPTGAPGAAATPPARLIPPRSMSLEQALEFLNADEVLEVTPRALRIRKRVLSASQRGRKA